MSRRRKKRLSKDQSSIRVKMPTQDQINAALTHRQREQIKRELHEYDSCGLSVGYDIHGFLEVSVVTRAGQA